MQRTGSTPNTWARAVRMLSLGALLSVGLSASAQGGDNCTAQAGTLRGFKPTDCLQEGGTSIGAISNGGQVVPSGYQVLFVLTKGEGLVIQGASNSPIFQVNETGLYTIHRLVYDPNTLDLSIVVPGVTTGFDVNALLIQGGGSICGALDVTGTSVLVDNPDAGSLSATASEVCLENGVAMVSAAVNVAPYVPQGYTVAYALTQGPGLVIVNAGSEPAFEVSAAGTYTVHTLVYDPNTLDLGVVELGVTTGFDVNGLLIQGGGAICAALDVAGAPVTVSECPEECVAFAGTLSGFKPTDCLQDGGTAIGGISNGDQIIPAGYEDIFVLTQGAGLVIQAVSEQPAFNVTATGLYTIHRLVYDPNTLDLSIVVPGVTTGFDVNALLIQGGGSICASLDVMGTSVLVDDPSTGTIAAVGAEVCLVDGMAMISASQTVAPYVPAGYQVVYVLTQGEGLVIVNAGAEPAFSVSEEGDYTIHTLVYDPATLDLGIVVPGVTTGFDVNSLLIQGGGTICASLDVAGAPVKVTACDEECVANAGTLESDSYEACLTEEGVVISATPTGNAFVPAGYSTVYVLTQGEGLVIVNAGATPSFNVAVAGDYTIHTLVYDPATLDLSIVVPGVTTGFDVNSLLIQGGGTICASLDVAGAPVSVVTCEEPCTALAGTLGVNKHLCLEDGPVTISATPNGDAVVPAGYSTVFVLTQGEGLVIVNAGAAPSFEVAEAGDYTIHTLVYDPNTLDLSIVVPGETTGFDVNSLLIQGGGSICASLDVAGAAFTVVACEEPCLADAGTLNGLNKVCLEAVGTTISATPNGDAIVPAGFSTVYVLTQGDGLVIVNAGAEPTFSVTEAGDYTIHTLVYDPATLDLSIVELGVTTGFDVNSLLIQGGGTICASLDVAGAPVFVLDCGDLCEANAGTLGVNKFGCLGKGGLTITATPNGDDNVPAGFSTVYVLTNGEGLVIVNAGPVPSFEVTEEGLYTIHTLVYDPATLDLGIVEIGVTTGFDVNSLLIQGGGSICASLDVAGAQFNVTSCGSNDGLLTVLNAWPVPAMDQLNLELVNERTARTEMAVYDMQGNQRTSTVAVGKGAERMVVDVKSLPAGQYIIRMVSGDRVTTHRFTKVD
ncbi:MAG: T9SS type A sorting domain-containing protein [Flavobacteriales bacterium]